MAGVLVPAPSDVIQHVSSTWRVYSRFGIVVIIGVTLMGAVGVAALITWAARARRRAGHARGAGRGGPSTSTFNPGLTPLASGDSPRVYRLLKDRPGGILAQYPLLPAGYGDSRDLYWQDAAGHPQLTGYAEDGHADRRALSLYFVSSRKTVRGLASLGVRYIQIPSPPVAGTPDPGHPTWGVQKIGTDAYDIDGGLARPRCTGSRPSPIPAMSTSRPERHSLKRDRRRILALGSSSPRA